MVYKWLKVTSYFTFACNLIHSLKGLYNYAYHLYKTNIITINVSLSVIAKFSIYKRDTHCFIKINTATTTTNNKQHPQQKHRWHSQIKSI